MNGVDNYIAALPDHQRDAVARLRRTLRDKMPPGFREAMTGSMPGYVVPLETYPAGYHTGKNIPLPFVSFAAQKHHIALYHFGLYADKQLMDWFAAAWPLHSDDKLDRGKSCIRFRDPTRIPFALLGQLMQQRSVEQWIACYDAMRPARR